MRKFILNAKFSMGCYKTFRYLWLKVYKTLKMYIKYDSNACFESVQ